MKCLRKKEVKEGKKEGEMMGKREEGERREEKRKEGRWTNKPNYMHTTIIGVAFKPASIEF